MFTPAEQIIIANIQDVLNEVRKLTAKKDQMVPVLPGTEPHASVEPVVYKDPVEFWRSLFSAPEGTKFELIGYGYLKVEKHFGTAVLAWYYDGLEDPPEYFGVDADMSVLHRSSYKGMLDILFVGCGPEWWKKVVPKDETGLSDSGLGIPGAWPCSYRTRNGLK